VILVGIKPVDASFFRYKLKPSKMLNRFHKSDN